MDANEPETREAGAASCSGVMAGDDQAVDRPLLSVIVPVRNEEAFIGSTLDMLLSQEYPRSSLEILVVDGESNDRTREIVQGYIDRGEPIRLIANPRRWSSSARNLGVQNARGEIVLVVDGHCELPSEQNFEFVVEAFERSGADIVGRPQPLMVQGASGMQQAIAWARASWLGHHPDSFIYCSIDQFVPAISVGAAYRRTVFDTIGRFDEQFDACEDVDFNHRADQAGLKCYLSAKARVNYHPRSSLLGLFRQLERYGRGRVRLARKHPTMWSLKSMAPAAALVLWTLGLLGSFWLDSIGWIWCVATLGYLVVLGMESVRIALKQRLHPASLWLPWIFIAIHAGAAVGALREWWAPTRRS